MSTRWLRRACPALVVLWLVGTTGASELQWQRHAGDSAAAAADRGYAREELRHAWSTMVADLHAARAALESPQHFPAPYGDRNLAAGYRYLLGHVHRLIEAELVQTTAHPYLMRFPSYITRFGLDNADTLYLYAPIEPNSTYLLIGRAENSRHWQGRAAPSRGLLAPRFADFTLQTAITGDDDELPDADLVTASIGAPEIKLSKDGSFEIMISPEPPAGYAGNHLATMVPSDSGEMRTARHLMIRQLFLDWARERSLYLEIVRVGKAGEPAMPVQASDIGTGMRELGRKARNHVEHWNASFADVLEPFADADGDGVQRFPRNCLGETTRIPQVGGAARALIGGTWNLGEEEALILEISLPKNPVYAGVQLSDYWGRSLDYANRIVSLNHEQSVVDRDGVRRYVVSHRDPGVANWLDTAGLDSGYILHSTLYPTAVERAPTVNCRVVAFDALDAELPAGTKKVDALTRRKQIMARQQHVARRYRQY